MTIVRSKTSTLWLFQITFLLENWKLECLISTFRFSCRSKCGQQKQDSVQHRPWGHSPWRTCSHLLKWAETFKNKHLVNQLLDSCNSTSIFELCSVKRGLNVLQKRYRPNQVSLHGSLGWPGPKLCFWQIFAAQRTAKYVINQLVFSSTGRRPPSYCHGVVSIVHSSVCPSVRASINSSFKKLLLRNYWLDFYKISQECSLGGPLSNSFK